MVEQGKPSFQWNGNATNVVTSPMMLEAASAVGGREDKIGARINLRSSLTLAKSVLQPGDKLTSPASARLARGQRRPATNRLGA